MEIDHQEKDKPRCSIGEYTGKTVENVIIQYGINVEVSSISNAEKNVQQYTS